MNDIIGISDTWNVNVMKWNCSMQCVCAAHVYVTRCIGVWRAMKRREPRVRGAGREVRSREPRTSLHNAHLFRSEYKCYALLIWFSCGQHKPCSHEWDDILRISACISRPFLYLCGVCVRHGKPIHEVDVFFTIIYVIALHSTQRSLYKRWFSFT